MPALLFYGSQRWKIPPENINFKPLNNNLLNKLNAIENPTIIMPLSAKNNANSRSDDFFIFNNEVIFLLFNKLNIINFFKLNV